MKMENGRVGRFHRAERDFRPYEPARAGRRSATSEGERQVMAAASVIYCAAAVHTRESVGVAAISSDNRANARTSARPRD